MEHIDSYDRKAPTPELGSRWTWEAGDARAEERIVVTEVRWNGEEWWVRTWGDGTGLEHWNDLSRFWEAVTP